MYVLTRATPQAFHFQRSRKHFRHDGTQLEQFWIHRFRVVTKVTVSDGEGTALQQVERAKELQLSQNSSNILSTPRRIYRHSRGPGKWLRGLGIQRSRQKWAAKQRGLCASKFTSLNYRKFKSHASSSGPLVEFFVRDALASEDRVRPTSKFTSPLSNILHKLIIMSAYRRRCFHGI